MTYARRIKMITPTIIPTSISTSLSFFVAKILGLSDCLRNIVRFDNEKSNSSRASSTASSRSPTPSDISSNPSNSSSTPSV